MVREGAPPTATGEQSWSRREVPTGTAPSPVRRTRGWEWGVIVAYAAALAVVIPRHEPWFDEAQAWLVARDSTLSELITTRMRYEGSPPLWHLILMPAAKLHLPYPTINVVAALISLAGVSIFVRRAPFPALIRVLLPFSFFVFYQYGVVARSYCLLAPLLFLLASQHPRKLEQPWRWCLLLALLANVSVHGFLIAGSLQLLHLIEVIRGWRGLSPRVRRLQVASSAFLVAMAGLVVYELWPPADLSAGAATNYSVRHFLRTAPENLVHAAGVSVVSVAVLLVTAWWLWRTRCLLIYALPTLAVLLLFSMKYFNVWHEGALFLIWVFALWVSFAQRPQTQRAEAPRPSRRPALAMLAAMVVSLLLEVSWSAASVAYDWNHDYSGSREMAAYIRSHGLEHKRIAALNFASIGLLPYFNHDIFIDLNGGRGPSYYLWSKSHPSLPGDPDAAVAMNPDYIVLTIKNWGQKLPCLVGYAGVHTVPAALYWKTRPLEPETFILYARTPGAASGCSVVSPVHPPV